MDEEKHSEEETQKSQVFKTYFIVEAINKTSPAEESGLEIFVCDGHASATIKQYELLGRSASYSQVAMHPVKVCLN